MTVKRTAACSECGESESAKHRLIYVGRGLYVCRNEINCAHRARRRQVELERVLKALDEIGQDRLPCGHTQEEHRASWERLYRAVWPSDPT